MTLANFEQQFLNDLNSKLWKSADKLRSNLDAANYKHIVLGLVFLKYVSDAFAERRTELKHLFQTESADNLYFMDPRDHASIKEYDQAIEEELELVDYYREKNVFWVPQESRWETLQNQAALPIGTILGKDPQGNDIKIRSLSWLIDSALDRIEETNPKLKNILNRIGQYQLDNDKLKGLIDTFSDTSFTQSEYMGQRLSLHSKDVLGHVYEYFLGQFALAEGKQGGQYYTPKSIVTLIVEMLEPYKGRVYDPAMGSGGFFVSSDKFIEEHAKDKHYKASEQRRHISVYGQESNPTTWKLAAMNMAIRGIDFNFGKKNADTFLDDQHPDLRADFVMANPPFNMKEWWSSRLEGDARWEYGTPPQNNANFAWLQHMLYHLAPTGSMALLLANGSMSSNTNNEGEIRKALIERDCVECMVALPGQLFTNTQIPACIWFLTKNKKGDKPSPQTPLPKREGQISYRGNFVFSGLLDTARELRKHQTPAEESLWQVVRDKQLNGLKFRRQHQIGPYIVDFYCDQARLIIELDGPIHESPKRQKHDHKRDAYLKSLGFTICRFSNEDWLNNPESVFSEILQITSNPPSASGRGAGGEGKRDRTGEILFIDARQLGYMKDRVLRDFKDEDIAQIRNSFHAWKTGKGYENQAGYCYSASLADLQKNDYVLTPGRYVGAPDQEVDLEPFAEKMQRLTAQLKEQFTESDRLEAQIKKNLGVLGYWE